MCEGQLAPACTHAFMCACMRACAQVGGRAGVLARIQGCRRAVVREFVRACIEAGGQAGGFVIVCAHATVLSFLLVCVC